MTVSISHDQRTILRSRVRRHSKAASVLPAGSKVSDLKNADLIQAALLLELSVPSPEQARLYREAKDSGKNGPQSVAIADHQAVLEPDAGGHGMTYVSIKATTAATTASDDTEAEELERDEQDDNETEKAPAVSENTQDKNDKPAHVKQAEGHVGALMAMFAAGDFEGFRTALTDLSVKAFTPVPTVAPVVHIDPSKIKGSIPNCLGDVTLFDVGVKVAAHGMTADRVRLAKYDAPDAPRVDGDYIFPDETPVIVSQLNRGRSVFLYGPAGTGKTSFAKQIAARYGRPYCRISCMEDTDAPTLTGMTVPDAQGGTKFQDGQLAAALRRPGTVVHIDEVTSARPGALFLLHGVMDDERALHVQETGEVIPLAPGVIIIVSDNTNGTGDTTGQYEATRIMNRAFLDRAGVTIRLGYMDPGKETKALMARTGCSKETAGELVRFANRTRQAAEQGNLSHGLTFRRLVALGELVKDGCAPAFAFHASVIETAPHDDREALRQIWTADVKPANMKG